ncbi:putative UDP-rhamnose:rhamnosyltransferase 1 [Triticum dicoccoides]|uniref:putative UDP-rhamnose:rhamnosyltransferase 1 n=1 Tax=Triticum dicoccoides TaxID=85692 RepID=UPI0018919C3E|nr:putative UDP-rhamnose:rhamnosyltransferase 1 [Triticum dicoccoides]
MAKAMEATARSSSSLHVVVFPWLAFGHMIPYLELSEQLARRGHAVTFVSAPRNLARLRPVPEDLRPRVRLLPLPLPSVDGLPYGAESTADVPPEKVDLLKVAFDGLAAPFAGFLAGACAGGEGATGFGKKPDWIFVDFTHHWLPPIAEQHKVPCALFSIFPAAFIAFLGPKTVNDEHPRRTAEDFTDQPPWIPFPTHIVHRLHEAKQFVQLHLRPNAAGPSDCCRFWETEQHCPLVIVRSCREVDGPLCPLLTDLFGKPVAPSGLLAPYDAAQEAVADRAGGGEDEDKASASLMRWLDEQPARSVIYVAFGSEAPLTPEQVRQLAVGLELSGARFLWALREPSGLLIPDGFEERVSGRGLVRVGWVPQVRVLAHGAVGAFLTHTGWSSLMESFLFGHPLVMLPLFADQCVTARAMAARAVGLEVPRDERDGSFAGVDVAWTVRRVMAEGEEGKALARNARAFQEILCNRAKQDKYVDELVEHLLRLQ